MPETLTALAEALPDDLIVIGGGGLFMDYFQPFWEGLAEAAGHVPFCIWGAGYCDIKREPSRPPTGLMQAIAARARLCILRDDMSRHLLPALHLPQPVPCPSLVAVDRALDQGHGLLHVDNYSTVGADIYEAMEEHGRAFALATDRPWRKTNNRITAGSRDALLETLALYSACDIVLSSALHGCIIAVAMGRKVLAVSGDRKIEGFMDAAGLGDWVLGQDDVDKVPELLARLPNQPDRSEFVRRARGENERVALQVQAVRT